MWDRLFLDQPLSLWALAVAALLATVGALHLLERLAIGRIRRFAETTRTGWDDLAVEILGDTRGFFVLAVGAFVGAQVLALPERFEDPVEVAVVLALLLQAGLWAGTAIRFLVGHYRRQELDSDPAAVTTMSAVGFVGRLVVWSVILLLALDNVGVDVTALIAGLGVGGIAVALAVQNILGDLFASLAIVLDKPFVIGDFLAVDDAVGNVEHIGLKTTRLRSLSGEQLVFSNKDLLSSRIRNFGRMRERRVVFELGVTYDTPRDVAARIPDLIRAALEPHEDVRVDRCHLKELGDWSLVYETVYYVEDPAYNRYMDIQQAVNLELLERFREEGIEFAFPTRTVQLEGGDAQIEGGDPS